LNQLLRYAAKERNNCLGSEEKNRLNILSPTFNRTTCFNENGTQIVELIFTPNCTTIASADDCEIQKEFAK